MTFNITSRIVTNILLNEFESSIQQIFSAVNVAISPISYCAKKTFTIEHFIFVKSGKTQFTIAIQTDPLNEDQKKAFSNYLSGSLNNTREALSIIFQSPVITQYINNRNKVDISLAKRIVFSVQTQTNEYFITLYIPNSFFLLFSKTIKNDSTIKTIENAITDFFKNPFWRIPDINIIVQSLNNKDLNILLNQLLQQNLLSVYQLYLLTVAYPELSLKLKQSLSKNRIQDILDFKNIHRGIEVTKRDLSGGIYSIQEALFFLLREETLVPYSRFLKKMGDLVTNILNMELLLSKSFEERIREMTQNKLLYKTLALTNDRTIADAIAFQPDKYITMFTKFISDTKIEDIVKLIRNKSYTAMINAQVTIIKNYKKSKFEKINPGHESLGLFLQYFSKPEHYNHLLLSVGWFTLSTALKDLNKKSYETLLDSIPGSARFLIEDVLKGVVNPNIIQDDMQIVKARKKCIKTIITLNEEGYIELEI